MAEKKKRKAKTQPKIYTTKDICKAISQSRGMISYAAKLLGCSPRTIAARSKEEKEIQNAIAAARTLQLDRTEIALFKAIDAEKPWAICFYLKCIGKERGYIEKQVLQTQSMTEMKLYGKDAPVEDV